MTKNSRSILDEIIFSLTHLNEMYGYYSIDLNSKGLNIIDSTKSTLEFTDSDSNTRLAPRDEKLKEKPILHNLNSLSKDFKAKFDLQSVSIDMGNGNEEADLIIVQYSLRHDSHTDDSQILLNKMLQAIHLTAKQTYQTTLLKGITDPTKDVSNELISLFTDQINIIKPKVIWCLGREISNRLLANRKSLNLLMKEETNFIHAKLFTSPTLQELIEDPKLKYPVWEQLKKIQSILN